MTEALERIAYQQKSKLASEIVSCIEKLMKDIQGFFTVKNRSIYEVLNYRKDEFKLAEAKISESILKHTGFSLPVKFAPLFSVNAFVALEFINKFKRSFDDMRRVQGQKYNKKSIKDFKEIIDALDLEKGKIKDKNLGKKFTGRIFVAVEFFDDYAKDKKKHNFNADEIAAIIMHEVGHVVTYAEHISNAFHVNIAAEYSLKSIFSNLKNMSLEEKKKLMSDSLKFIDDNRGSVEDNKFFKASEKTIKKVEIDYDKMNRKPNIKMLIFEALAFILILGIIALIINTAMSKKLMKLFLMKLSARIGVENISLLKDKIFMVNPKTEKLAETLGGMSFTKYDERWADQYATMHGLGLSLQTALHKMHIHTEYSKGYVRKTYAIIVTIFNILNVHNSISDVLFNAKNNPLFLPYDITDKRTELMIQNAYVALKDRSIPSEIRNDVLEQIKQLRSNQKKFNEQFRKEDKLNKIKKYLNEAKMGKLTFTLSSSEEKRLINEYHDLADKTGFYMDNPFYYHYNRVHALLDKK